MKKLTTVLALIVIGLASASCSWWPRPSWCTGVCEIYAAQIEIANEDATPAADRQRMREAEARAWDTLRRGDLSQIHHDIVALRCAAGLGSPAYRAEHCPGAETQ